MASNAAQPGFAGKVAIITGGSQGLGEAVARAMANRGAAGLLLVGRDQAKGEATAASIAAEAAAAGFSTEVAFTSVDLAEPDAPARIVAAADDRFGRLDAVCNAAALTVRGSVWDTTAEMWDDMLAVNTRAPALLVSESAKLMKRDGIEGSIVLIGSVASHGGQDFLYPYSASKLALRAIVKNASFALMQHRIRVNLIQPGWMNTPAEDGIQRRFHGAEDGWLEAAAATRPFGRLIDPAELARTVAFCCSDESGLMTGAIFDYDQTVAGAGDPATPSLTPVWGEPS